MLVDELKELKEKKRITNQELADKSGVPLSTINRIMSGKTPDPGYSTAKALLNVLGELEADKQSNERIIRILERYNARLSKWIKILSGVVLAMTAVFVFLLIWDLCNLNIGFIRTR